MKLIDGKKLADEIKKGLKQEVSDMFHVPGLAIILVGEDRPSHTYVGLKEKFAKDVAVNFEKFVYPTGVGQKVILQKVQELNDREDIHGIVVQLPLPSHLDADEIILTIMPEKDVDGFHPVNLKRIRRGEKSLLPALVKSIVRLTESTGLPFTKSSAALIVNSRTFVDPLVVYMERHGMKTSIILPPFAEYKQKTSKADLIVIAIGQPHFLTGDAVKKNAVIIDVGFTHQKGKVIGDVDQKSVKPVAGWLTPVPGGVGPMTVAMLLENTVEACKLQTS